MTPNVYRTWHAQSPRLDFAERTVAAMMRDRIESRRGTRPHRWMTAFAVACVLVVVGALAWAALPRTATKAPAAADVAAAPPEVPRTIPPLWRAPAAAEPPTAAVPPPLPAVKAARHKETVPADKNRHVNLPRCSCDPMICDCVEPQ
jgi:hypothetical protein